MFQSSESAAAPENPIDCFTPRRRTAYMPPSRSRNRRCGLPHTARTRLFVDRADGHQRETRSDHPEIVSRGRESPLAHVARPHPERSHRWPHAPAHARIHARGSQPSHNSLYCAGRPRQTGQYLRNTVGRSIVLDDHVGALLPSAHRAHRSPQVSTHDPMDRPPIAPSRVLLSPIRVCPRQRPVISARDV